MRFVAPGETGEFWQLTNVEWSASRTVLAADEKLSLIYYSATRLEISSKKFMGPEGSLRKRKYRVSLSAGWNKWTRCLSMVFPDSWLLGGFARSKVSIYCLDGSHAGRLRQQVIPKTRLNRIRCILSRHYVAVGISVSDFSSENRPLARTGSSSRQFTYRGFPSAKGLSRSHGEETQVQPSC